MEYAEARNKFIQSWGALGSQWGINKTMAQIHALLMISEQPLSMEDIMEELQISRGNASMNLRGLMDWGLVYKEFKAGERREYFSAEKNVEDMAVKIARERSKREIKPALRILKEVSGIKENNPEAQQFVKQTGELYAFMEKADNVLDKVTRQKDTLLSKFLMKFLR
ncbi:MAG: MarR family transcriptional regulator [Bacteroidia bacterium]|nr:MarR family transcriptional regulator [Bacteroidia bacterium]